MCCDVLTHTRACMMLRAQLRRGAPTGAHTSTGGNNAGGKQGKRE
jgi:hypothetical protein